MKAEFFYDYEGAVAFQKQKVAFGARMFQLQCCEEFGENVTEADGPMELYVVVWRE